MADQNKEQPNTTPNPATEPQDPQELHTVNTDYMKEQIKQHPVNRKRLLRRTVTTCCMAVLFGAIACIVFMVAQPIVSNMINPQEEPETVTFPEETPTEEMSPEDMIASDADIVRQEVNQQTQAAQAESDQLREEITQSVLDELEGTEVYAGNYTALAALAAQLSDSMVTVTGVTADTDWVGDAFENSSGKTSGMIIAETDDEYYIYVDGEGLAAADEIRVTMSTGDQTTAAIRSTDAITGTVLLSLAKQDLPAESLEEITPVTLGSSARADLLGQPVIAIGAPSGTPGSVNYGVVTNAALPIDVTDSGYNRITTDIYGSTSASGALVDLKGRVIGWITMDYNSSDSQNLISAVGITEMKVLLERMSNEGGIAYLGVHAATVPESVNTKSGVPLGAYVSRVEMSSPAMNAGIQSGDVITAVYGNAVSSAADLMMQLQNATPDRVARITLMRQSEGGYTEIYVNAALGNRLD